MKNSDNTEPNIYRKPDTGGDSGGSEETGGNKDNRRGDNKN